MTRQHPGEPDRPAEGPGHHGEDLSGLMNRLLAETDRTQKELADAAGIPYKTLNAWRNRSRGTSRIDPDTLRDLTSALRKFGAEVTPKQVFEAAGRPVPGPSDQQREAKLLALFRAMTPEGQRALIQTAEAMQRGSRAS